MPISAIADGTSNTIAVIEDAGRVSITATGAGVPYYTLSGYPETFTGTMLTNDITDTAGTGTLRGVWRWADPDACGSGVSGPPNAEYMVTSAGGSASSPTDMSNPMPNAIQVVCQNNQLGGPTVATPGTLSAGLYPATDSECPWTTQNCGANDEPFSFHPAGCNAVFVDGAVRFLSSSLDPITMRRLVTRAEGLELDRNSTYRPELRAV